MSKMTHTPGPWEFRHEHIDPEWAVVCTADGRVIANVNAETGPDIPPLEATKMPRDANARLIAAAPQMLALLEKWADFVQGGHDISALPSRAREMVTEFRAATRAAEGKG